MELTKIDIPCKWTDFSCQARVRAINSCKGKEVLIKDSHYKELIRGIVEKGDDVILYALKINNGKFIYRQYHDVSDLYLIN